MARSDTQDLWLETVLDQLRALDDVMCVKAEDGRLTLEISRNGESREITIDARDDDYRALKMRYGAIRDALTGLGIEEGMTFVAPPLPRRPMTPMMRAAREQQKNAFEAWQDLWKTLRKAEKALDVEYEIAQMKDYY
jgi:hypothetical protein